MSTADSENNTARAVFTALGIGTAGGCIFAFLNTPLAFLLGAMLFTLAASLAKVSVQVPVLLRSTMIAVLGVMMGSAFTPDIFGRLHTFIPALGLLAVIMVVCAGVAYLYFRFACGYDRVTAYFAGVPGGLSEMSIIGEAYGGDVRTISTMHAIRIIVVVCTIPFFFRHVMGVDIPVLPDNSVTLFQIGMWDALILTLCALVGLPLGHLMRLPAGPFLGPLLLSIAVHAQGWSSAQPPIELVAVAQIVLGTAIGVRFTGTTFGQITGMIPRAVISALIMIAIAAFAAWAAAPVFGIDAVALFLALAPGGLAEMSIIALSMGGDPIFVSTIHMIRILIIIALAPVIWSWTTGQVRPTAPPPAPR